MGNNNHGKPVCDSCGGGGQISTYDKATGKHTTVRCSSCNGTGQK